MRAPVLDTSVLIDLLRGDPRALQFLLELPEVPVCSEVTRIEVLRGMRSAERAPTERLFAELRWMAVDEPVARRAGTLGRKWRASHPGLALADLAVAATAQALETEVATTNVRLFPMFEGLQPPY